MISAEQLTELEQLAREATPWTKECWCPTCAGEGLCIKHPTKKEALIRVSWHNDHHDVDFVSAANPGTILELIAQIRQLEKEAHWLSEKLSSTSGICALPEQEDIPDCALARQKAECAQCWRKAAREAVNKE